MINMVLNLIVLSLNVKDYFLPWNTKTLQDELKGKGFFVPDGGCFDSVTNSKPLVGLT